MTGNLAYKSASGTHAEALSNSGNELNSNVRRLRLLSRRRVTLPAIAVCGDRHLQAEVRNISQSGVGIRVNGAVSPGDAITVHLVGGRKLHAHVRWTRMGFCGVEFDELLHFQDELLGELSSNERSSFISASGAAESVTKISAAPFKRSPASKVHRMAVRLGRQLYGWTVGQRIARTLQSEQRMIERAVRKQGHAWLVD